MWNSVTLTNPGQIWKLLKIHARGCGTLISHTHWNLDGGLNAMVHVATPPVAANSRGQRLQISFAALRSTSQFFCSDLTAIFFRIYLHASTKQFQRSNHGTVLFILSWSYLPKKWHVWKKKSAWHIPIAGQGSWRQPRSIMQQQNRRRRRQSWIQRAVRIDAFWNDIVWYKRAWEQNSNDTRWNDINWYGHVMCKLEWRPRARTTNNERHHVNPILVRPVFKSYLAIVQPIIVTYQTYVPHQPTLIIIMRSILFGGASSLHFCPGRIQPKIGKGGDE